MRNKTASICQFKIVLRNLDPPIWRRVLVKDDITLHRLSSIILLAMGWKGGHLRRFDINGQCYEMPLGDDIDGEREFIDERKVLLREIKSEHLKNFLFVYDYGDNWNHAIEFEGITDIQKSVKYPTCVDGVRNCPPDDCGGPHGYMRFLEQIKDASHEEHEASLEWIGGWFDPEAFDPADINRDLKQVVKLEKMWWSDEQ